MIEEPSPTSSRLATRSRWGLREYVTGSWVLFIVAFTAFRVVVVRETLQQYGLNIWVFGFIDLATAIPYAMGVARTITSLIDGAKRAAMWWSVVAVASFIAPYLYVAWAGRGAEFPTAVWVALGLLVLVFAANALWSGWRKVRRGRVADPNVADPA